MKFIDWVFDYIDIFDSANRMRPEVSRTRAGIVGFIVCYISLFATALLILSLGWILDGSMDPTLLLSENAQTMLLVTSGIFGGLFWLTAKLP